MVLPRLAATSAGVFMAEAFPCTILLVPAAAGAPPFSCRFVVPPAALLAQVDGAVSNTRTATDDYLTGSRDAYITCARLIREHLGGPPSPLARVAAEVMACHTDHGIGSSLPPADYFASIRDLANGEEATGISSDRDRFEMIGALTLAGMLACDAAPVGGAKGGE